MSLSEILDSMGLAHLMDDITDEESDILDQDIEVHIQPTYPLKCTIRNVRKLNGTIAIACSDGTEYGDHDAWEQEY